MFEKIDSEVPSDDSCAVEERMLLYWLVRNIKPKVAVEVGTHKGLTTLYLAQALEDNKQGVLHTCDPYDWGASGNFRKFPELEKRITYYGAKGEDINVDYIDFLFLDGAHEYPIVRKEIDHFKPKFTEAAVVVFHDCAGDGNEVGSNQAVIDSGLQSVWIPTPNCIRIYCALKNPPFGKHYIADHQTYVPEN